MRDFKKFPKVSEGLSKLLDEHYGESFSVQEAKFREILDKPIPFTWKVVKSSHSPRIDKIHGEFKISKEAKYDFEFYYDYNYNLNHDAWVFIFTRHREGDTFVGTDLSSKERETSKSVLVFSAIYQILMKFIAEVQPVIFEYSGADKTLAKAYEWMSKFLAKKIENEYSYDIEPVESKPTHFFVRKVARSQTAMKKYPEGKNKNFKEKVMFINLMKNQASSPKSLLFKKERYKIMGQEVGNSKFIQCGLTKNGSMDFYFLAESTRKYKKGHKRKSADIHSGYRLKDNPSEAYQITLRVLQFLEWVDVHPDKKLITPKDIAEILMIANIEVDSDVPGWYWQGGAYWLQQLGGTIYKRLIRKPKKWNRPFPKGHGEARYYLDKITQGIINSIGRYIPKMAQEATKVLKEHGKL